MHYSHMLRCLLMTPLFIYFLDVGAIHHIFNPFALILYFDVTLGLTSLAHSYRFYGTVVQPGTRYITVEPWLIIHVGGAPINKSAVSDGCSFLSRPFFYSGLSHRKCCAKNPQKTQLLRENCRDIALGLRGKFV